ncbi:MAG: hypothetical protein ACI8XO_000116 [Verrucomicrobiales bacterium]|jgi:hypothetical protein
MAKKGGGKPGGEDPPPDPEPTPAPISYVLTWIQSDGDTWSRFHDVDANGVAVGFFGGFADRYGIVSFPDRNEVVDLESVAATHPDYPGGRLLNGYTISEGLVISGDLQDPTGKIHCYALQLIDNGPGVAVGVAWFHTFSPDFGGLDGIRAYVVDASESGDILIETTFRTADGSSATRGDVWRPAEGAPSALTVVPSPATRAINRHRDVVAGSRLYPVLPVVTNLETGQSTELGLYNDSTTTAYDLGDDGTVVGWGRTGSKRRSRTTALRFVGGAWEAIDPTGSASQSVRVNSVGQILGISGSAVFLFSGDPDFGFRLVDNLLDPAENTASDLALWDAADPIDLSTPLDYLRLGDPNGSGFGHICGRRMIDGVERGFILTPVAP